MSKKSLLMILSPLDIAKYMYTNIKVFLLVIMPMFLITAIIIIPGLFKSRTLLRNPVVASVILFILIFPFILPFIIGYTSGNIGYWVENCTLYVRTGGTVKIPLDKAEVRLVPYEEYKPVLRTWGVGVPGLVYGKVLLRNGRKGIALVFQPQKDAILITYQNTTIVISHPGIRESYEKLLRYQEACIRRGG